MMDTVTAIAVVKTLILLLGGVITLLALRAYRSTGDRGLGLLTVGFAIVTGGAVLGGFIIEFLGYPLHTGVLVESLLVLIGFGIIAASLWTNPR